MLYNNFKDKKSLMLFLSTTDSSSSFFRENLSMMPSIEGKVFNFHRTVEQLFINKLMQDLPINEKLERLKAVGQLIKFREENLTDINMEDDESYDILKKLVVDKFNDLREEYVNTNLARKQQFEPIKQLYDRSIEVSRNGSLGSLTTFYNRLQKMSNEIGGEENLSLVKDLEKAFRIEQIFAIVFKKSITKLTEGKPLVLSRGNDSIQSTGHHLPIVFRYDSLLINNIFDDIAKLYLSQIAFYTNNQNKEQENQVINRLKELTSSITEYSIGTKTIEEKIVFCLYLLILPDAQLAGGNKSNSFYVEEFLLDLLKKIEEEEIDDKLYSDFLYILSWVLRRNVNFELANYYTRIGIETFPNDARFYHSRFLLKICGTPENESREVMYEYYNAYLKDIHKAKHHYQELLSPKDEIIKNNIEAALLNSEIYTNTLIYSISSQKDRYLRENTLYDLRNLKLNSLKEILGDYYFEYPEFLHTEAFLEMNESDLETDPEKKSEKLNFAIATLNLGLEKANKLPGFRIRNFKVLLAELNDKKASLEINN